MHRQPCSNRVDPYGLHGRDRQGRGSDGRQRWRGGGGGGGGGAAINGADQIRSRRLSELENMIQSVAATSQDGSFPSWLLTTNNPSSSPPQELACARLRQSLTRPPLPQACDPTPLSTPTPAIPFPFTIQFRITSHDVRGILVNDSAPSDLQPTSNSTSDHVCRHRPTSLEVPSSVSVPTNTPYHVSINNPFDHRPRTSPVFTSTSDLAAHYGIPQFLPPAPSLASRKSDQPTAPFADTTLSEPDFSQTLSNYLTMLSQKPKADQTVVGAAAAPSSDSAPVTPQVTQEQVMALLDSIQASPEFTPDFSEFLTSPSLYGDSPADEFLTTPQDPRSSLDEDITTSPMLFQGGFDSMFESNNLFAGFDDPLFAADKSGESAMTLDMANMFVMPLTPATPALQSSSFYPSPSAPSSSSTPPTRRRSTAATGTRKNITPASLVPVDAPTQTRKYVTPSATSRKELPAVFARKRSRSQAAGDDEQDEVDDDLAALPPNPTEQQLIEAKRRQNTVAARRSRKRKLEHQRALEDENEQLRTEVDELRAKARTYEALLRSHGITFES